MATKTWNKTYTEAELQETVEVKITLENETKTFNVLRLLLTTHAPGFSGVLRCQGVKSLTLDNVSPKTFDEFIGWLRMEDLARLDWYCPDLDPFIWEEDIEYPSLEYAEAAVNGFLFAEAYDIHLLRQDAIDRLVWYNNTMLDGRNLQQMSDDLILRAYTYSNLESPLRSLLTIAFCLFEDAEIKDKADLPKDFLIDVIDGQKYIGKLCTLEYLEPCDFHGHATEEKKNCEVRVWISGGSK